MGRFVHLVICLLSVAPVLSSDRSNEYRRTSLIGRYRYVAPSSSSKYYSVPGASTSYDRTASTYPRLPVYPFSGDKYPESYPTRPTAYYPPSEYNAPSKPYVSDQYSNQEYETSKPSLYSALTKSSGYGSPTQSKYNDKYDGDYRQSEYNSDKATTGYGSSKSAGYEDSYTSIVYDGKTGAAGYNDYKSSGNDYKSSGNDYKSSGNDYKSSGNDYKSSGNDYKSSGNDYKSSGNDYKSSDYDYKPSGYDYKSSGNDYKSSDYDDYKSSGNDYKSADYDDYKSSGNDYKSSDHDDYKSSGLAARKFPGSDAYGSSGYGGKLSTSLGSQIVKFGNGYTSVRRLEATDAKNDLYLSSGSTNYLYILQKYGMKEDPCKHGVKAFPVWDVCFAYFTCESDGYGKSNGVKWHDCGDGNRFDAGQGKCVPDATCKSACQNAPHIKPTHDPYKFVLGNQLMDCPPNTYFDFRQCACDHVDY